MACLERSSRVFSPLPMEAAVLPVETGRRLSVSGREVAWGCLAKREACVPYQQIIPAPSALPLPKGNFDNLMVIRKLLAN